MGALSLLVGRSCHEGTSQGDRGTGRHSQELLLASVGVSDSEKRSQKDEGGQRSEEEEESAASYLPHHPVLFQAYRIGMLELHRCLMAPYTIGSSSVVL
jgi:hypothetical protein